MMADATHAMAAVPGMPPTIGFINSGGVLKDGILTTQTGSSFRAVLAPKLASSGAAFTLVDQPVHHVQLFSSSAALLGNPGQSNYAAANATLEGWATFSRNCGVNAIAIQWGPWEVGKCCFDCQSHQEHLEISCRLVSKPAVCCTGMAATDAVAQRVKRSGMGMIEPSAGLSVLSTITVCSLPSPITAMLVKWKMLLNGKSEQTLQFFDELLPVDRSAKPKSTWRTKQLGALQCQKTEVLSIEAKQQARQMGQTLSLSIETVQSAVEELVGSILGQAVDPTLPLMEAGLDSLGAIELRNAIVTKFGVELTPTVIFDYPTTILLSNHLVTCLEANALSVSMDQQASLRGVDVLRNKTARASHLRRTDKGKRNVARISSTDVGGSDPLGTAVTPIGNEISAVVESLLGKRVSLQHTLMSAGLDSLGKLCTTNHFIPYASSAVVFIRLNHTPTCRRRRATK